MLINPVKPFDTHFSAVKLTFIKKKILRRFLAISAILVLIVILSFSIIDLYPYSTSSLDEQLTDFHGTPAGRLFVGVL